MTVGIDDAEVIHAYYSLIANDDSRDNKVVSEAGSNKMTRYKESLSRILTMVGKNEDIAHLNI